MPSLKLSDDHATFTTTSPSGRSAMVSSSTPVRKLSPSLLTIKAPNLIASKPCASAMSSRYAHACSAVVVGCRACNRVRLHCCGTMSPRLPLYRDACARSSGPLHHRVPKSPDAFDLELDHVTGKPFGGRRGERGPEGDHVAGQELRVFRDLVDHLARAILQILRVGHPDRFPVD